MFSVVVKKFNKINWYLNKLNFETQNISIFFFFNSLKLILNFNFFLKLVLYFRHARNIYIYKFIIKRRYFLFSVVFYFYFKVYRRYLLYIL